jgi:hypothetical protein
VNLLPPPRGTSTVFKSFYSITAIAIAAIAAIVEINTKTPPPAKADEITLFCFIIVGLAVLMWTGTFIFGLFWHRDIFDTEPFTLEKRKLDQMKGQPPNALTAESEKP